MNTERSGWRKEKPFRFDFTMGEEAENAFLASSLLSHPGLSVFIWLSAGLESLDDLLADLDQAIAGS